MPKDNVSMPKKIPVKRHEISATGIATTSATVTAKAIIPSKEAPPKMRGKKAAA